MITLDDVMALVSIDSVSHNEDALCSYVEAQLVTNPLLEVVRIGDNVVARTTGASAVRLLVAGHLDTVPGDVHQARIADGVLHGLGACDMKGSLAGMLHLALDPSPRDVEVTWVFYAREEIARSASGLLEIAAARPDLLVADAAVLGEPTNGAVEAGCQGTLRVEVTVRGARAHTARPFTGRNAIHRLGAVLARVASYEPRAVHLDGVTFTEQLQAVNVSGGIAANVVPDSASVTLNHRVAPDRDDVAATSWLRTFLGDTLDDEDELRVVDWAPSATPDLTNAHLARLVALSGAVPAGKVGWTDVATFQSFDVAATNFGAGDPLLAHRADEFVTLVEVRQFVATLDAWLNFTP